jgi:hypothetical protein
LRPRSPARRQSCDCGTSSAGTLTLAAAASAAPTKAGTETFTLSADINSEGGTVTATGVIDAVGNDISVTDTQDTFDFGGAGQITVFHSVLRRHHHLNKHNCTAGFTETGTYVFGNGTGQWAGYNGSGTYTAKARLTDACGDNPVGTVTLTGTGPINLADGS